MTEKELKEDVDFNTFLFNDDGRIGTLSGIPSKDSKLKPNHACYFSNNIKPLIISELENWHILKSIDQLQNNLKAYCTYLNIRINELENKLRCTYILNN